MKSRLLLVLFLTLAPCLLRAQNGVTLRPAGGGDAGSTYGAVPPPSSQHLAVPGDPSAPLRPGDTIDVRVSGVPDGEAASFDQPYTVDEQGMINLPYINQVKVGGLLPGQAETVIQNSLIDGKIYTHPTITVQQSTPRFVNVNGEVRSPQRVPYTADMTLMTVITASGGFTDYANKKKVELTREGKVTVYNTEDIRKGKVEDPKVVPADKINVPQSFW